MIAKQTEQHLYILAGFLFVLGGGVGALRLSGGIHSGNNSVVQLLFPLIVFVSGLYFYLFTINAWARSTLTPISPQISGLLLLLIGSGLSSVAIFGITQDKSPWWSLIIILPFIVAGLYGWFKGVSLWRKSNTNPLFLIIEGTVIGLITIIFGLPTILSETRESTQIWNVLILGVNGFVAIYSLIQGIGKWREAELPIWKPIKYLVGSVVFLFLAYFSSILILGLYWMAFEPQNYHWITPLFFLGVAAFFFIQTVRVGGRDWRNRLENPQK